MSEFSSRSPLDYELLAILLIRLLAVVSGAFMLRGANWARWVLVAWMAYHIVLSAFHSVTEFALHAVLFGTLTYFLFRTRSSAYFRH